MISNIESSRIDKDTCKFVNPVMENQYMTAQWARVKKELSFGLIFICFVLVLDSFAASLEQANKNFGTEISFSHEIYTALTKELYE